MDSVALVHVVLRYRLVPDELNLRPLVFLLRIVDAASRVSWKIKVLQRKRTLVQLRD